jgi:murein DD-endopeptidase MepM/ murein hydrolase activator NlpD
MQQGFRFRSVYAHLSAVNVSEGAYIHQGDVIGAVGNSGTSAGVRGSHDDTHLHLEVRFQRPGKQERYLGEDLNEEQIRRLLKEIFTNA